MTKKLYQIPRKKTSRVAPILFIKLFILSGLPSSFQMEVGLEVGEYSLKQGVYMQINKEKGE